jgi:hypothetical protein
VVRLVVFVYTAPRMLIAERVAPRYDADLALIYSVRRVLGAGTEFRLITNSDMYGVYIDDDDAVLKAVSETVHEPGFRVDLVEDHDDTTYATPITNLSAGETRVHVTWDLGSLQWWLIVAVLASDSSSYYAEVATSHNAVTWGVPVYCAGASCTIVSRQFFRYIRLRSTNESTAVAPNTAFRFYTLEVYPENIRKTLVITADTVKTVRVISRYASQLLEFMRLT